MISEGSITHQLHVGIGPNQLVKTTAVFTSTVIPTCHNNYVQAEEMIHADVYVIRQLPVLMSYSACNHNILGYTEKHSIVCSVYRWVIYQFVYRELGSLQVGLIHLSHRHSLHLPLPLPHSCGFPPHFRQRRERRTATSTPSSVSPTTSQPPSVLHC